jgi:hypothetical protein
MIRYESKKGSRINHTFLGMTTFEDYWWVDSLKRWVKSIDIDRDLERSTHRNCNSVKAFKRMIKTAPNGIEFILVSRWVGYNVTGINKSK